MTKCAVFNGIDMPCRFCAGLNPIVTVGTIIEDTSMIHCRRQPATAVMAGRAVRAGAYMTQGLTTGLDTIMAT